MTKQMVSDGYAATFLDYMGIVDPFLDYQLSPVQGWAASSASMHPSNRFHTGFAGLAYAAIGARSAAVNPVVNSLHTNGNSYFGPEYTNSTVTTMFYDGNWDGGGLSIDSHAGVNSIAINATAPGGVNIGGTAGIPYTVGSNNPFNMYGGGTSVGYTSVHETAQMSLGVLEAAGSATSGANFDSQYLQWFGSYWNGLGATQDIWQVRNVCSGGTNPDCSLVFSHDGSPGGGSLNLSGAKLTNIAAGSASTDAVNVSQISNPPLTKLSQAASGAFGGGCTMSSSVTCSATITASYTTPMCIASAQGLSAAAAVHSCSVSGSTVTVTAGSENSQTWAFFVFGNPN